MSAELFPLHSVCHLFSIKKKLTLQYLLNINSKTETKTYLDSIHSDFYSFVKTDDSDLVQGIGTSYNTGKGGVVIMCRKFLSFSIKEIPCPESNRIIGAELSDK